MYSFDPREETHPFQLVSKAPTGSFKDFALKEARFRILASAKPEESARLLELGQHDIDKRYHYYEQLAGVSRSVESTENGNGNGNGDSKKDTKEVQA